MLTLFCVRAFTQESLISSKGDSPKWITNRPSGYINDYFVGEGESRMSLPEASKEAVGNAVKKILQTKSFEATSSFSQMTTQDESGIKKKIVDELIINGSSVIIKGLTQEESYYESWNENQGIVHRCWVLVKVPKSTGFQEPPTKFSPVWRSIIAPSWGQFYKGQPTKGYIIALSEAVLIPTGIILQSLKSTAEVDARNSRTQVLRDYYTDEANTYLNFSTVALVLAGAIYIYNIVDAIVSYGDKVYVYEPQQRKYKVTIVQNLFTKSHNLVSISIEF